MSKLPSNIILWFIKVYQTAISPLIPARCRYYPTCSEYGKTAIQWHGLYRGGRLLLLRISRCHPLGGSGVDFVPIPLYRYQFYPLAQPILVNPIFSHNYVSHETFNSHDKKLHLSHGSNANSAYPCHQYTCNQSDKLYRISSRPQFGYGVYIDSTSYRVYLNYLLKSIN